MNALDLQIEAILDRLADIEGGYSNNRHDTGGATMRGVTEAVARRHGWSGPMRDLPHDLARTIFTSEFILDPQFDRVLTLSPMIAEEMIDTGVNLGVHWPALHLQQWLNCYNHMGDYWPDLVRDGKIGDKTQRALRAFLDKRGDEGERVMVASLNASQGERYKHLIMRREANEEFAYGWMLNRVTKQWPNLNRM